MIAFRDTLLYLILRGLALPFLALSYPGALRLGVAIARLLFPLFPKYRRIALDNISHAFPEETADWHEDVLKRHIDYLGRLLADVCWKPRMNRRWSERFVRYEDSSLDVQTAFLESAARTGTGIILVSGHIGTWENVPQFGGPIYHGAAIYKKVKNPYVDRWILRERCRTGTAFFPMDATHSILKELKSGRVVMMAADQNAGSSGILVDFLHRPASTYRGPAFLAALTGAPLYFVAMLHGKDGLLHLHLEELGPVDPAHSGTAEAAVRAGTERWVRRLEDWVRRYPEQYFWVHRRWKTTPEMMERMKADRLPATDPLKGSPETPGLPARKRRP